MAIEIKSNPALITSTGTGNTEIYFSDELDQTFRTVNLAFIEVVSGSFNFNTNGTASSTNGTYVNGDKLMVTFGNGKKLSYKAGASSQTFKISF